jgi:hypothetical protein
MRISYCHIYAQHTREKYCANLGMVNILEDSSLLACVSMSLGDCFPGQLFMAHLPVKVKAL